MYNQTVAIIARARQLLQWSKITAEKKQINNEVCVLLHMHGNKTEAALESPRLDRSMEGTIVNWKVVHYKSNWKFNSILNQYFVLVNCLTYCSSPTRATAYFQAYIGLLGYSSFSTPNMVLIKKELNKKWLLSTKPTSQPANVRYINSNH